MRKFIVVAIFISTVIVHSQDKEPNHWEFFHSNNTTKQIFEPDSLKQTRIYTGFQWNYSDKMNNALENTCLTTGTYHIPEVAPDSTMDLIIQPKWLDRNFYNPTPILANS